VRLDGLVVHCPYRRTEMLRFAHEDAYQKEIDKLTNILRNECLACERRGELAQLTTDTQLWWIEHKRLEAQRQTKENALRGHIDQEERQLYEQLKSKFSKEK
jgi:hypothetical protein